VTIKSLFFCLFLYVCLVWVGSAYLNTGADNILHYGLLWTSIGLIAVLAFIIGARLFGWWRLSRAKASVRPAPQPKPVAPVHPDDETMSALVAEANAALAKAPSFAGRRDGALLSKMPLYLLIGPEGSGKTSTFLNSGLEPQLLAGQGTTPVSPTRLCNLWLAKDAIFAEIGGRSEQRGYGLLRDVLRAARTVFGEAWGDNKRFMVTRDVTLKALLRLASDVAAAGKVLGITPGEDLEKPLTRAFQPWSELVREFRREGFYERFPAPGQSQRVEKVRARLAREAGLE